jgi:hypothetical protein
MAARICSAPLPIRAGLSEAQHRALVWALHGAALVLGAGLAVRLRRNRPRLPHPFSLHRPNLQAPSPRPQPRPSPTRPVDIVAEAAAALLPAADADLRDLIPDAAIKNPEAWAKAAHPAR